MSVTIPKNYSSVLNFIETQEAIKFVKDTFERKIAEYLNLTRYQHRSLFGNPPD